jgi:hypothetical protein
LPKIVLDLAAPVTKLEKLKFHVSVYSKDQDHIKLVFFF